MAAAALVMTGAGAGVASADDAAGPGSPDDDSGWGQSYDYGQPRTGAGSEYGYGDSAASDLGPDTWSELPDIQHDQDRPAASSPSRPVSRAAPAPRPAAVNPIDVPPPPGQVRMIDLSRFKPTR